MVLIQCPHCDTVFEFSPEPETPLRAARLAKEMSLRQVSDIVGISIRELSRLERGIGNPRIQTVRRLASLYESSVDQLWPLRESPSDDEVVENDVVVEEDASEETFDPSGIRLDPLTRPSDD